MNFAEAVLEDLAEANQNRQGDAAQLQVIDQFLQIDLAFGILVGMHADVAGCTHAKVALAPAIDVVQLGGLRYGPAVGGLANRRGLIINTCSGHEISVSFDLARVASKKFGVLLRNTNEMRRLHGILVLLTSRAASSAGRAPRSQRGGRGFEPHAVHQFSSVNIITLRLRKVRVPYIGSIFKCAAEFQNLCGESVTEAM